MTDQHEAAESGTDELRRLVTLAHSTLAYGSTLVALTLVLGWAFAGLTSDVEVPTLLPILAVAAVLFTVTAWIMHEEIRSLQPGAEKRRSEVDQRRS